MSLPKLLTTRILTHETIQPGMLYAVGPCTCKGKDANCPRCAGTGVYAVKAVAFAVQP